MSIMPQDPDSKATPPRERCVCGHERWQHPSDAGCLVATEPEGPWDDDCQKFHPAELRVKVGPAGYDDRWWWAIMTPDRYVVTDGIEASWDDASAAGLARLRALDGDV